MAVVIGYATAFRFWRSFTGDPRTLERVRARKAMSEPCRLTPELRRELHEVGIPFDENYRLHLVFSSPNLRKREEGVASHVYSGEYPAKSLVRLSEQVLIASPELCFAQMADAFTRERAIMGGFELCGTYTIGAGDALLQRSQLTTAKQLREFTRKFLGEYSKAYLAAKHVLDNAASPMEAKLAMLLTLPTGQGGFGLPAPVLNGRIALGQEARRLYDVAYCKADLYWPEALLDVEYDGTEAHRGAALADIAREQALAAEGVAITRLTYPQVEDPEAFAVVAKALARRIGKPLRIRAKDFEAKVLFLRAEIEV